MNSAVHRQPSTKRETPPRTLPPRNHSSFQSMIAPNRKTLPLAETKPNSGKKATKRKLQSTIVHRGALGCRTRTRMHEHWCAKHKAEATNTFTDSIRAGPAQI